MKTFLFNALLKNNANVLWPMPELLTPKSIRVIHEISSINLESATEQFKKLIKELYPHYSLVHQEAMCSLIYM